MNETFSELVKRLVAKCKGVQAEAARMAGVSTALISDTLQGKGPVDPKRSTVMKIYEALGEEPPAGMIKEVGISTYSTDKAARLATWLRSADPRLADTVYAVAQSHGFNDQEEGELSADLRVKSAEAAIRSGEAAIKRGMETLEELRRIHNR